MDTSKIKNKSAINYQLFKQLLVGFLSLYYCGILIAGSSYNVALLKPMPVYPANNANGSGTSTKANIFFAIQNNIAVTLLNMRTNSLPLGVTKVTSLPFPLPSGQNLCSPEYSLTPRDTSGSYCVLVLQADGSLISSSINSAFNICADTSTGGTLCLKIQSDPIRVIPVPSSTLEVQPSGNTNPNSFIVPVVIPNQVPEVAPVNINVGSVGSTAYNLHMELPASLESIVNVQYFGDCMILAAGKTCHMALTTKIPFLPVGDIKIVGDNVPQPITNILLASSMYSYPVFDLQSTVSPRYAKVLGSQEGGIFSWDTRGNNAIATNATSLTNGNYFVPVDRSLDVNGNGYKIRQAISNTGLAQNSCYGITLDNSRPGGPALPLGTWYLPSICELGGNTAMCGNEQSVQALVSAGFMSLAGMYWSSTEDLGQNTYTAWTQNFTGQGSPVTALKNQINAVRCVRAFSY